MDPHASSPLVYYHAPLNIVLLGNRDIFDNQIHSPHSLLSNPCQLIPTHCRSGVIGPIFLYYYPFQDKYFPHCFIETQALCNPIHSHNSILVRNCILRYLRLTHSEHRTHLTHLRTHRFLRQSSVNSEHTVVAQNPLRMLRRLRDVKYRARPLTPIIQGQELNNNEVDYNNNDIDNESFEL